MGASNESAFRVRQGRTKPKLTGDSHRVRWRYSPMLRSTIRGRLYSLAEVLPARPLPRPRRDLGDAPRVLRQCRHTGRYATMGAGGLRTAEKTSVWLTIHVIYSTTIFASSLNYPPILRRGKVTTHSLDKRIYFSFGRKCHII